MNKKLTRLLTLPTLIAVVLTTTAFGFSPIFHPPTVSILDALRNDEQNFSILIELIRESGLEELTKEGKSFTLLAPTNAAFAKLPEGRLESLRKDKKKLRQLLFNHLLAGKILFKGTHTAQGGQDPCIMPVKPLINLGGNSVDITCTGNRADNSPLSQEYFVPLINGKARVLEGDIEGRWAALQVMDTVLLAEDDWELPRKSSR
jgi:uncharacterized surface protein with fasciclin (FAS1) repeats